MRELKYRDKTPTRGTRGRPLARTSGGKLKKRQNVSRISQEKEIKSDEGYVRAGAV